MNELKKCLICGLSKDITFPQTVHIDSTRNYIRLDTIKADDKRSAAAQDGSSLTVRRVFYSGDSTHTQFRKLVRNAS